MAFRCAIYEKDKAMPMSSFFIQLKGSVQREKRGVRKMAYIR
jgi:hypothetical protein